MDKIYINTFADDDKPKQTPAIQAKTHDACMLKDVLVLQEEEADKQAYCV